MLQAVVKIILKIGMQGSEEHPSVLQNFVDPCKAEIILREKWKVGSTVT